ncbi:hypothetical protein [uncultured Pseudoteredinibacter sp.]|uniref:hypothetical protein n=1 Tax=uncultured Pseudoteredinibacter sp. TaxID=1641701 RepID=UPI00261213C4|nr:hypothetical protein [uncultured Pseudoteredinibacter sp.]
MNNYIKVVASTVILSIGSASALAALSDNETDKAISNAKNSLQLPESNSSQKYCRKVRNSLYGKFRKKCRTVAEWNAWIAVVAPKIERQWQLAGATNPRKGGTDLDRATPIIPEPFNR